MQHNKIFLIILILTLHSSSAVAQKGPYAGVYGTALNSWLLNPDDSNDPDFDYGISPGYSFGVEGGYYLLSMFGFGMELNYSKYSLHYTDNGSKFNTTLDLFKLPVLAVFSVVPREGRKLRYMSKLGPELIFLSSGNIFQTNGSSSTRDAKEVYNEIILGAVFAVGAGYNLSDNLLLTGYGKLDFGVMDFERSDAPGRDPERDITNLTSAGLEIGLRYLFR